MTPTTPETAAQTYQILQHFTERIESNFKNVLQSHYVDSQKKKKIVNVPRVEAQCLRTSEVLEKRDNQAKSSKQAKKRKIDFSEASD